MHKLLGEGIVHITEIKDCVDYLDTRLYRLLGFKMVYITGTKDCVMKDGVNEGITDCIDCWDQRLCELQG